LRVVRMEEFRPGRRREDSEAGGDSFGEATGFPRRSGGADKAGRDRLYTSARSGS
jgi:hypothetical protein